MNNVKRSLAALFALVLVLSAGCGKKAGNKVVDYTVDVPGGFEETEMDDVTKAWYNMTDSASISVNITEKDADFQKITADALRNTLAQYFEEGHGVTPTITDRYFTNNEVCGLPAYQYCYTIELMGVEMTQLIVCIDADQTYTVTYTDNTGGWISEFETSARNINLVLE